ncbi:MAG: AgmX/PglI C-terminal domain-containing protein, partial [Polyangiaceae bacterium]
YVPTRAEVREERRKQQSVSVREDTNRKDVEQIQREERRIEELNRELRDMERRTQMARDDAEERRLRNELDELRGRDLDAEQTTSSVAQSAVADNKSGGTGTRAKAEEGAMGNPNRQSAGARYGVRAESAPAAAAAPAPAAQEMAGEKAKQKNDALKDAENFGMIGLLNPGAAPASPAPPPVQEPANAKELDKSSPARRPAAAGDPMSGMSDDRPVATATAAPTVMPSPPAGAVAKPTARTEAASPAASSNVWGADMGDSFGAGGLGLSGIGTGGGGAGDGDGIGLGTIGTLGRGAGTGSGQGFGSGSGRISGEHKSSPPTVRMGQVSVSGKLPPEVIQRIVRQSFGRFRLCYENGLRSNPTLAGRVTVKFTIDRQGAVNSLSSPAPTLPDSAVVGCVTRSFSGLSFPQPESGTVSVTYPIDFAPSDAPKSKEDIEREKKEAEAAVKAAVEKAKILAEAKIAAGDVPLRLGDVGHTIRLCAPAASLPLDERVVLWRERLQAASGSPAAVRDVFLRALAGCEAPTWRERNRLLYMMVDSLPEVRKRVELWRLFGSERSIADILYQAVIMRVQTAGELKELHQALGLKKIDPTLLEKELASAKSPGERAVKLKSLVAVWPDDLELALKLLDAYEDLGDIGAGRGLARELRHRGDANARLRTAVGELYFRASKKPGGNEGDVSEARRTFGEIVEFSPQDPVARRRLGDLLRAHGFYDEAFRQYETLGKLTPDDTTVPLLLASAAQGMGRTEEAIRWTEKSSASNSPDGGSGTGRTSRAFASVFLAWARDEAVKAGRKDEADRLRERARRLTALDVPTAAGAKPIRVVLSWAHPELHPVFWSNALGAPMPAPDGDPLLGIAQVMMPGSRADGVVEIRFEKEDAEMAARLGAELMITMLINEGSEDEKIVRYPVVVKQPNQLVRKLKITSAGVEEI